MCHVFCPSSSPWCYDHNQIRGRVEIVNLFNRQFSLSYGKGCAYEKVILFLWKPLSLVWLCWHSGRRYLSKSLLYNFVLRVPLFIPNIVVGYNFVLSIAFYCHLPFKAGNFCCAFRMAHALITIHVMSSSKTKTAESFTVRTDNWSVASRITATLMVVLLCFLKLLLIFPS